MLFEAPGQSIGLVMQAMTGLGAVGQKVMILVAWAKKIFDPEQQPDWMKAETYLNVWNDFTGIFALIKADAKRLTSAVVLKGKSLAMQVDMQQEADAAMALVHQQEQFAMNSEKCAVLMGLLTFADNLPCFRSSISFWRCNFFSDVTPVLDRT